MIIANPTKSGTGIQIWGDYGDLNFLYQTASKLMVTEEEALNKYVNERSRLLSFFCYELDQAFLGNRDIKKLHYTNEESCYFGFKIDWVTYIMTLSCLRDNASFVILDEADIANIRLLEYWGKHAMIEYDEKGANSLKPYIELGIHTDEYVYFFHQMLVHTYYTQKPTVNRFRKIPELFNLLYGPATKRNTFVNILKKDAEKLNCDIGDLDPQYGDIDFKW